MVSVLSSSRPKVLEYLSTLRFWMDRWSRDQPQPGSLFQRLREAEKRDPGNDVGTFCEIYLKFTLYCGFTWKCRVVIAVKFPI